MGGYFGPHSLISGSSSEPPGGEFLKPALFLHGRPLKKNLPAFNTIDTPHNHLSIYNCPTLPTTLFKSGTLRSPTLIILHFNFFPYHSRLANFNSLRIDIFPYLPINRKPMQPYGPVAWDGILEPLKSRGPPALMIIYRDLMIDQLVVPLNKAFALLVELVLSVLH